MQILQADTAVKVVIGPFVDVGDGHTPETGVTLGAADQAELIKHDAAAVTDISASTWAAIADCAGWYNLSITTGNVDTEGMITIVIQDDSVCLPVYARFQVVNANVYDSLFKVAGTDKLQVDVTQLLGTALLAPSVAGTPDVNAKLLGGTAQTGNDVGADVNEILTDTGTTLDTLIKDIPTVSEFELRTILAADYIITSDTIAGVTAVTNDVGITQAGADKVWGTAVRALTDKAGFALSAAGITSIWENNISAFAGAGYAGTYLKTLYDDWLNGGRLDLILDIIAADVVNIDGDAMRGTNSAALAASFTFTTGNVHAHIKAEDNIDFGATKKASINTEADSALSDIDLDHLIKVSAGAEEPIDGAYLDQIMHKAAGQSFDAATDSLEAIRDQGDTAWITGGGGSITDILNVQPLIPLSIDLANTVSVRTGLGLTNMLDDLPSTAEITPGTITIDRKAYGGTSWTNIVNAAACSEVAGLVYYDEVFDSGTGYAAGDTIRVTFKSQKITVAANDYEITGTDGWIFYTYIREEMRGTDSAALAASYTATRAGYLDNINNANLATIADISSLTSTEIAYLNASISSRSSHNAADIWSVGTRALTDKAGFSLAAAGITAIWEKNISAFSGAGYAGTYVKTLYDDWINAGRLDAILDIIAADVVNIDGDTMRGTDSANTTTPPTVSAIADQVWDEVLTGAVHNIATSAGRRLRQAADVMIIREETCQAGGGNDEIIFDVGASAVNEFYINDLVVLTSGTGVGQQRHIDSYVGATKTAIINRDWTTNPDATTNFVIKADSTKHVHGFETVAKAEIESEVNDALVALNLALEATLTAIKGSGFLTGTDSLEAIRNRGDAAWTTGVTIGSGALSCTWTQKDDEENPMDNVQVWITTDEAGSNVVAGTLLTDASGEVTFMLDEGTYYVWREKGGYNFTNPQTWAVS